MFNTYNVLGTARVMAGGRRTRPKSELARGWRAKRAGVSILVINKIKN